MTRYILFNNAPTIQDCLASVEDTNYSSRWHISTFQFQSLRPENDVGDTTASQFKDANEEERQREVERGEKRVGNEEEESKKKPRTSWEGGESTCQSCE